MRDESEIQQLIQIEAAKTGTILLRNNSGSLLDKNNRPIRFGLGNVSAKQNKDFKSSDLIGITPVVITKEMVGVTIAIFTAIEVKKEGWKYKGDERENGQNNFINWVKKLGGLAGFCNSIEDFKKVLGK